MIIRVWLIAGVLLLAVAWTLVVPLSPPPFQETTGTTVELYRAERLLPGPGDLRMSSDIGHEVFEVPPEDAEHAGDPPAEGHTMPGMAPGMTMGAAGEHSEGMAMDMPQAEGHGEATEGMAMDMPQAEGHGEATEGMAMDMPKAEGHGEATEGMAMEMPQAEGHGEVTEGMAMEMPKTEGHGEVTEGMAMEMPQAEGHGEATEGMAMEMPQAEGHGEATEGMAMEMPEADGHGEAEETMAMEMPQAEGHGEAGGHEMAMEMPEGGGHSGVGYGLRVLPGHMGKGMIDRDIEITMAEWEFGPGNLTVKPGEVVRLVVRNEGTLPHEFMLMPQQQMNTVNYRLERADWNLLEHEAVFERSVILPGDSFEVVVRFEQAGMWMYMCMFPYHMQFGMMGMIMTEGMQM
jgi:uncharacterized cupredoxin-like copper-binding protein